MLLRCDVNGRGSAGGECSRYEVDKDETINGNVEKRKKE